jgi:hypothetical protein
MATKQSRRAGAPAGFVGVGVGVVAALGLGCSEGDDPCEGLRTFDPPPAPESSDTAPPTVLAGEWISADVLELQFSRPLAVGSAPDPSRFALLSWAARAQPYDYQGPATCYVQTRYTGLGVGYYQSNSVADVWVAPEDPSLLRLRMASPSASCRAISDTVAEGILLVYVDAITDPATARLTDAQGDLVPDIGPQWAIPQWEDCFETSYNGYNYCGYALGQTATGHLPALNVLAPIPCPA